MLDKRLLYTLRLYVAMPCSNTFVNIWNIYYRCLYKYGILVIKMNTWFV